MPTLPKRNMGKRPGSHSYRKFHKAVDLDLTKGLVIYTDGASFNNGKKNPDLPEFGGWGMAVVLDGEEIGAAYGGWEDATISVCELEAVCRALEYAAKWNEVTIVSDSQYVIKGITEWSAKWRKNAIRGDWQNSEGSVKNQDLWKRCISLIEDKVSCKCTFAWIKGHSGDFWNDRADELAGIGRDEVKQAGSGSGFVSEEYFDNLPDRIAPETKVEKKPEPPVEAKPENTPAFKKPTKTTGSSTVIKHKKPLKIAAKVKDEDPALTSAQNIIEQLNKLNEDNDDRFEIGASDCGTKYIIIDNKES